MNLQKLTKLFVVRRVGSSVTEGERNDSPSSPCTGASDIWIDNFIRALNVASALGGSFPPLKAATETLNVILKDFQGVRNNTADLRGLVAAITKLLKLLNDQIRSYGEAVSKDAKFIQLFNEFNSCLLTMKEDIDEVLNKSYKSLGKRTLHKDALSRLNTDCMKRMDDLRLNFLVQLGLDTRRIIASGYNEAYGVFFDIDTSDYYKYKTADIHLIESLLSEDRDQLTEESFVKVDGKPDIYTFRRYCGNDAFTMFRKDLEAFSRYKHPNIRQMFGICESKLSPGILFRGKLVRLRDYSARDALNSLMSWVYFVDGYKAVAPYFKRHLKRPSDGIYPLKQCMSLVHWEDVYIDISADDHRSVWPIPESDATELFDPVVVTILLFWILVLSFSFLFSHILHQGMTAGGFHTG